MGLFDFLMPKSFDALEEKADRMVSSNDLGLAKLEYEKALSRLEASSRPDTNEHRDRIKMKIVKAAESLARQHKSTAEDLVAAGCLAEAGELLTLARELTTDTQLGQEIATLLSQVASDTKIVVEKLIVAEEPDTDNFDPDDDDGYLEVLLSTLPDEIQEEYMALGTQFESGYVALNRGDFGLAAERLNQAMLEQGGRVTYAHLELATAHLNLGNTDAAQVLLEAFIDVFPESLRAYESLCELYWDRGEYDLADRLLQACPDTLKLSVPILLLMGETLRRSDKLAEAVSFYLKSIEYLGWQESIAVALARTYDAAGQNKEALEAYQEIVSNCRSCHQRLDPLVRHRFAELRYQAGDMSSDLLETYFALCRENPRDKDRYYRRISIIYEKQGYADEARRYLEIAMQLANEQDT